MLKKLYRLLFLLSLGIFILLSFVYIPLYDFNSNTLKENISYLSSDKIAGRISGSKENELVSDSLSLELSKMGLSPLTSNGSFKEGFTITVPYKTSENGVLQILNKDNTTVDFTYGVDFKEDLLNFKENNITLSKEDNLKIHKNALTFNKNGDLFLFYITDDSDFNFRSSFIHDSSISFSVALKKEAFDKILKLLNEGSSLYCNLPYSTKLTEVYNVAGKIEGTDKEKAPLILSAHFDHLGTDCLDNIYCGALDNASGTAFLFETLKVFSSLNLKPDRDIIFVFLNAEEFGLLGSEAFSEKYASLVSNAQVINFDMLGAPNTPLSIVRAEKSKDIESKNSESLQKLSKNPLKSSFEDSSDHASFSKKGADALTITHSDTSRIHTPKDTVEHISTSSLDEVFKLVNKKIINHCYPTYKRILLNNGIYLFSFSICLIYITGKNIQRFKYKK
ncbi:MAG: M28 family metallopeptidase [Clostridium sp.]|uniref:M28 family metallopeptidase n=1 Tax=Clostridium sp. TaxID=1506 RepID=UPI003F2DC442